MVDEEWDVVPTEETAILPEPLPQTEPEADNGSSAKALWQSLLGLVVGLLSLPLIADGFMHLVMIWIGPGVPVPVWLWVGGLTIALLIEAGLGLGLRRISDMCAITFAIAAFFSILETVAMMNSLSPLALPKLAGP